MAAMGNIHEGLLQKLNDLGYYKQSYPKSLANSFGTDEVFPLIKSFGLPHTDGLRTYVEHIVVQVTLAIVPGRRSFSEGGNRESSIQEKRKLLVTGGGAFNRFLMERLSEEMKSLNIEVVVPDEKIVSYKEALIMALIGVLRWRQEYNIMASVTGAQMDSIGGAVWIGQEA